MKRVLALVLTLVLVLGLGAFSVFAEPMPANISNADDIDYYMNLWNANLVGLWDNTEDDLSAYDYFSVLYLGDDAVRRDFGMIWVDEGIWLSGLRGYSAARGDFTYGWRGDYRETVSFEITYTTETGGRASGSPKGVNGEELLHIRHIFNTYGTVSTWDNDYTAIMTPIANPTVELFRDVKIKVRLVHADGANIIRYDAILWDGFALGNKRYTDRHVYADANGLYRIDASSNWPVVDVTAFEKSYGKKLIIDYPTYRIIFPTVKNQNTSLNLQAAVTRQSTVDLDDDKAIMLATFHDIRVKDAIQIEFKVGFDVQNYKGVDLYAYGFKADGTVDTAREYAAHITENATVIVEVPANASLSANGAADGKLGTFGLFATPQKDGTPVDKPNNGTGTTAPGNTGGGTSGGGSNPSTGASDVINVATAFAVVSLAAAAFVSTKKASK